MTIIADHVVEREVNEVLFAMRVFVGKLLMGATGGAGIYTAVRADMDPNNVGVVRFARAGVAVGKIAFDYRSSLFSDKAASLAKADYETVKGECHQRSAETLLKLCETNGGVFIKVGQHIGALDYLLPEEYVNTMKVLHSRAPQMPLEDIYEVVREELGQEPTSVFSDFDPDPLGSASLAQVHRARLPSGEEVAVKVQHKYVKRHSLVDIWTCDFLVRMVKAAFPQFEFMWLADEMKKNLPLELCFTQVIPIGSFDLSNPHWGPQSNVDESRYYVKISICFHSGGEKRGKGC